MICPYCGKENEGAGFCTGCGMKLEAPAPVEPAAPVYTAPQSAAPAQVITRTVTELPPENRPLSGWAYFGLQLLFAVPVVGFVFLIVFSFSRGNINRRNFARSYWCALLVAVVLVVVIIVIALLAGVSMGGLMESLN